MSDIEQRDEATLDDETPVQEAQVRGMIDGSLNNANLLSGANFLGVLVNSKLTDDRDNVANTRSEGNRNNAVDG